MKYLVTYETSDWRLPQNGFNVWEVEENKKRLSIDPSFKILNIIIGGKKRHDAENVVIGYDKIVDTKEEVIVRIFNL